MPRDGCEACGKAKLTASRTALGAFRQRLQASHCSQHLLTKLSQPTAAFSREIGYGTLRSSVVPSSTSISTELTSSCPAQHKGRSTLRGDWRWQWQARVLVEQRKHSRRVSSFPQLDLTWWHLSSCGHVHGIHSRRGLGLLGGSCSGLGCPHLLRVQCPPPVLRLWLLRRIRAAGRCHYTALHRRSLRCTKPDVGAAHWRARLGGSTSERRQFRTHERQARGDCVLRRCSRDGLCGGGGGGGFDGGTQTAAEPLSQRDFFAQIIARLLKLRIVVNQLDPDCTTTRSLVRPCTAM